MKFLWAAALAAAISFGLAACEKEGTVERAGEEVDETVDTMKHGEESTATKVDDAVDEMREGAREATEEAKE
jgi:hypothetical protein